MKKVIITGANGFIGSSLANKLMENNVEVVAIDIAFNDSRLKQCPRLTCLETSVDDVDQLLAKIPVDEYDVFYHLAWAGVNGPAKADPDIQLKNIQYAVNCAKVAKRLNCKKLFCAGTVAERGIHSIPSLDIVSGGMLYAAAKYTCHIMMETYCKNIGLPFVWLQFSNIYGVGNKTGNLVSYTLGELMAGKEAAFGPAQQPYDFIYVDDLLEAVYRLGASNTKLSFYYIGSGSPRILKEYLLRIGELAGMKDKVGIGIRPDDGIKYDFSMFDTTPLREAIGDYVSTPFEEGIKKTINWLKEQQ